MFTRKRSENIQHILLDRESGLNRKKWHGSFSCCHLIWESEFYKVFTPTLTIQDVNKPLGYIRKFTPDGKLLLTFSPDQRGLEVYGYQGVAKATDLLKSQKVECITALNRDKQALYIRQEIYRRLFKLRWNIPLASDTHVRCHLNREFSVFLDDGRFVLLAAVGMAQEIPQNEHILQYPDLYDNIELYKYTFYLIDLNVGCVVDLITYRYDFILLSHNHGLSVFDHTIAVFSKYRQCIDLWHLVDSKLMPMYIIGAFGIDTDEILFKQVYPDQNDLFLGQFPLTHLKQRILTHLYQNILKIASYSLQTKKLREFYRQFKLFENMIISKIQLIDRQTLLIRYDERKGLVNNSENSNHPSHFKLYVFYSITAQQVLKVFAHNSTELMHMLRNFCDNFRNARSLQTGRPSSSSSNNAYFRSILNSVITSMPAEDAATRLNPTLPISTQSYSTSPFLDYSLFNYDERLISPLERPRLCLINTIRFTDRKTHKTKFQLHLESSNSANTGNEIIKTATRELVGFIFHPFEPFIISIQKFSTRYIVNFHIYNRTTIVGQ